MKDVNKIERFLAAVDKSFPVPLSDKQDLSELAEKFVSRATLCCIEEDDRVMAMVAGYTENVIDQMAYISVVATLPEARGKGYASRLVMDFIELANKKGLLAVHLYTHRSNFSAIKMYEKLGFVEWRYENETRPNDLHLIFKIDKEENK